ncbi:MAG: hypothetical protein ACM335_05005, partial [Deltaproteobacteria bacterium]
MKKKAQHIEEDRQSRLQKWDISAQIGLFSKRRCRSLKQSRKDEIGRYQLSKGPVRSYLAGGF